MFIDQLRNLIIKICHYYQWHETFNFPGLIFAYALIPDNELRDAFQLKLKTPMVYHQQVFWEC